MEERILKKTAVFIMVLSMITCAALPFFPKIEPKLKEWMTSGDKEQMQLEEIMQKLSEKELLAYYNRQEKQAAKELVLAGKLRLQLPFGVSGSDLEMSADYVSRKISVRIPYAGEDYLHEYSITGKEDHLERITYESQQKYGVLEVITDQVFEITSEFDEDYFYLDFLTPHEVYDKVVVIDAGHGGEDAGTVKQGIHEKDVDLDILLKLKEIIDASGDASLGFYYTRTEDVALSEAQRAELANKTGADLFVSIHNNSTPSGRMSNINGTQAMYDETDETGAGLAQIFLEEVTALTGSSNKGIAAERGTNLLQSCTMPAVIVEAGFMTNEAELNLLCTEEYQIKVAQGIYQAILRALSNPL